MGMKEITGKANKQRIDAERKGGVRRGKLWGACMRSGG